MANNLIGKRVTITDKDDFNYGDWGTIKDFDGDYYYIAMFDDTETELIFTRDQFKVRRGQ